MFQALYHRNIVAFKPIGGNQLRTQSNTHSIANKYSSDFFQFPVFRLQFALLRYRNNLSGRLVGFLSSEPFCFWERYASSQALKLSSSQALKPEKFIIVVLTIFLAGGCEYTRVGSSHALVATKTNNSLHTVSIDAGIVFTEESNYICIPLTRLGILDSVEVVKVHSSCECSRPSIIEFEKSVGKTERALRIDFDADTSHSNVAPMNLAIAVELELAKADSKCITISFLLTRKTSR